MRSIKRLPSCQSSGASSSMSSGREKKIRVVKETTGETSETRTTSMSSSARTKDSTRGWQRCLSSSNRKVASAKLRRQWMAGRAPSMPKSMDSRQQLFGPMPSGPGAPRSSRSKSAALAPAATIRAASSGGMTRLTPGTRASITSLLLTSHVSAWGAKKTAPKLPLPSAMPSCQQLGGRSRVKSIVVIGFCSGVSRRPTVSQSGPSRWTSGRPCRFWR